jgi:large subunit ribosomal protein L15
MLSLDNRVPLTKKRKRVGRGGSRGGTSGRGHKGQNARSGGGVGPVFEGGQMPLTRRLPKRGFNNTRFAQEWITINLGTLSAMFENGAEITKDVLCQSGTLNCSKQAFFKVLGNGTLDKKLIVHAHAFSKSALEAIEKHGGQAHVVSAAGDVTKEM